MAAIHLALFKVKTILLGEERVVITEPTSQAMAAAANPL
jgi:hypothetical protein